MTARRLYSITWNRQGENPGEQCCNALTAERLVSRLRAVLRNSSPITIHAVERDRFAEKVSQITLEELRCDSVPVEDIEDSI